MLRGSVFLELLFALKVGLISFVMSLLTINKKYVLMAYDIDMLDREILHFRYKTTFARIICQVPSYKGLLDRITSKISLPVRTICQVPSYKGLLDRITSKISLPVRIICQVPSYKDLLDRITSKISLPVVSVFTDGLVSAVSSFAGAFRFLADGLENRKFNSNLNLSNSGP